MKNTEIRNKLYDISASVSQDTRQLKIITEIIGSITLFSIIWALFLVEFTQLKQEKNLLISAIKLNSKTVSSLVKQTIQFRNIILKDDQFDNPGKN